MEDQSPARVPAGPKATLRALAVVRTIVKPRSELFGDKGRAVLLDLAGKELTLEMAKAHLLLVRRNPDDPCELFFVGHYCDAIAIALRPNDYVRCISMVGAPLAVVHEAGAGGQYIVSQLRADRDHPGSLRNRLSLHRSEMALYSVLTRQHGAKILASVDVAIPAPNYAAAVARSNIVPNKLQQARYESTCGVVHVSLTPMAASNPSPNKCPECGGSGYITLLTSRERCARCNPGDST